MSLLDSTSTPKDMVEKVKLLNQNALAVTDHGNIASLVETYKLCKKNNIKHIIGCEFYICDDINIRDKNNRYYHLVILAKSEQGRLNINNLITKANIEGFYYKPRIDFTLLQEYSEGLIVLSACMAGEISRALENDDYSKAKSIALKYKNTFGDDYYLEIQAHKESTQQLLNRKIVDLAKELDIQWVSTCDSHFINEEDQKVHAMFIRINAHRDTGEFYNDCYIQSEEEVEEKLSGTLTKEEIRTSIDNTVVIADKCNAVVPLSSPVIPHVEIPNYYKDEDSYLKHLIEKGWENRNLNNKLSKESKFEYTNRVKYEFEAIKRMGFSGYYLLVESYANSVKRKGIARGCFTGDALVVTKNTLKTINNVNIGDMVITDDGCFNKVVNKYEYDINEDMIEFEYKRQGSSYKKYKNICTLDHKILVNRNNIIQYVPSGELVIGDLLCHPRIINTHKDDNDIVIDLLNYNYNNFEYDDNYIYEVVAKNEDYKYCPRWFYKNKIPISHNWAKRFAYSNVRSIRKKGVENEKLFFQTTPFKTREQYKKYCYKHGFTRRKIPRYIKLNCLWNIFIGMMYGDGWTEKEQGLGFAINNTSKNGLNKYVFYKIAEYLSLNVNVNKSKTRNLTQLYIHSKIINNWFSSDFFKSEKGKDKYFANYLLDQNLINIKWLFRGLTRTDGSINIKDNKICFDNTSLSLINTYKIMNNMLGYEPLSLDIRLEHRDSRGYNSKESYKARRTIIPKINPITSDNMYWYLPITKIIKHENMNTKVYDLQVENNKSYMINNIIVHNSGGGSLIAYLLNIVDIDPMKYGLYFERFIDVSALDLLEEGIITPEELKIPDFDLDFGCRDREHVVESIVDKYGQERVAAIGSYQYVWDKSAIKDIGKVLEIPFETTNEMTKILGEDTIDDAITDGRFGKWVKEYPDLFYYAKKITGLPKSFSTHPCGKIVGVKDLIWYAPLVVNNGEMTLQLDMDDCESLGMVKVDLLGLRTLDLIYDILEMIDKDYDYINPQNLDFNDKKVYEEFQNGNTIGVFQFESSGMKNVLKKMKASSLDDLGVCNALYRPGSLAYIDNYTNRKHGLEKFEYLHPDLEPILKVTYGIIVFQEQLIEIGRLAGMRNPDKLRKATGKKKPELLLEVEPEFKNGLYNRGWTEEQVEKLWNDMLAFAKYSFNKSHAYAYAIIAFIVAFLKVYHPREFLCALFNSYVGKHDKFGLCNQEVKRLNIPFEPFSFREISSLCYIKNNKSVYGINLIKYLNETIANELFELSKNNYSSFVDLLVDIKEKTSCSSRQIEILIRLQFFNEFGGNAKLLNIFKFFNSKYKKTHKDTTKEKRIIVIKEYAEILENLNLSIREQVLNEIEYLGYIKTKIKDIKDSYFIVTSLNLKYTPVITAYCFNTEQEVTFKIYKSNFNEHPLEVGTILKVYNQQEKEKVKPDGKGGWQGVGELETVVTSYSIVKENDDDNPITDI